MAFYDEEQEEDQVGQGPQTTGPQSGVVGADGAQQAAASNGAAPAPGAAPAATKREPFVGISEYLNANKPQSEKLAGQVAGNVETKAQGVDTALSGAQNSFNQAADSQKVDADQGLFSAVQSNAAQVAGDQDKASQFAKLRDASYSGPQKLEDVDQGNAWAGIQSALQKAKDAKAATGTEAGRMGLIKEISNNPRQSQGALVFDNLLLQSNPNAAGMLQKAGSNLNDIDSRLSASQQAAADKAKAIAGNNAATAAAARGALTSGYQGLGDELTSREAAKDQEQQSYVDKLKADIKKGTLDDAELKALNLPSNYKTFGLNVGDYVDYKDGADKYSVATQDDLARQAALKQLAGNFNLGDDILSGARPLGEVGSGYNVRTNELDKAKSGLEAKYTSALKAMENEKTNALNSAVGDAMMQGGTAEDIKDRISPIIQRINAQYGAKMTALSNQYKANSTLVKQGNVQGSLASPQLIRNK